MSTYFQHDGAARARPCGVATLACTGLVLIALQCFDLQGALEYSRGAMKEGQWWRLLTGHLVHLGWVHLGANLLGLLSCAVLAPTMLMRPGRWLALLGLLCLGVSFGLYMASPGVSGYVGLSGVLYGLFAFSMAELKPLGVNNSKLALLVMSCWVLVQCLWGAGLQEAQWLGGVVVGQAHLYGMLTGLALASLSDFRPGRLSSSRRLQ